MSFDLTSFDSEFLSSETGKEFGGEYVGSKLQRETYESLQKQDARYKQFIAENYGSFENYLNANKINQEIMVFDPMRDFMLDVTVITKDKRYKSNHISAQEVILEAMSGVCTTIFIKADGSVGRLTGTLMENEIPGKDQNARSTFFSPLANSRIVMWDVTKQGWRSFYMSKALRFIRDDTIGIE